MNSIKLRLTGRQHEALYQHPFPGDSAYSGAFGH